MRGPSGKILKPGDCRGYLIVNLNPDGTIAVHRLVALTFLTNRRETVNHKNGIKTDNRLCNLEWVTRTENQLHAVRTGLRRQAKPVLGQPDTGGGITWYPSMAEAAYQVNGSRDGSGKISACIKGKRRVAFGHHWVLA